MAERDRAGIEIEIVDTEERFLALAPFWNELLLQNAAKSVFLTWEWIRTWWATYGSRFQLCVLVARDRNRPCGIAPLIVREGSSQRLEFIGQNRAYGEYLDFIVSPGMEDEVTSSFCRALMNLRDAGVWHTMCLAVVRSDSVNLPIITRIFGAAGVPVRRSAERISPIVELRSSWQNYLEVKSPKLRQRIAYNERRLGRLGAFAVEYVTDAGEIDEFFDDFKRLHLHRWSAESDDTFFDFHRLIAHRFFDAGRLLLARLRVKNAVVAAKYDYVFDNRAWGYQGGWLLEYGEFEVGSILLCEVFKRCIERRISTYDFLEGDDWYKQRWATDRLCSYDLTIGRAGPPFIF
jgi:CelD/BcsL family acetyltransferase involved in cellulose biosynthesis